MGSSSHGNNTSAVEITHISSNVSGSCRMTRNCLCHMRSSPWFKEQPVKVILNVEEPSPGHFYWPDLDVDLSVEAIEHPERFPLMDGKRAMTT